MNKFNIILGGAVGIAAFFLSCFFFAREIEAITNMIVLCTCAALLYFATLIYLAVTQFISWIYEKEEQARKSFSTFRKKVFDVIAEACRKWFTQSLGTLVTIGSGGLEALSEGEPFVKYVRTKFKNMAHSLEVCLFRGILAVVQWVESFKPSNDTPNGPAIDDWERERLVFIVSLHSGYTYAAIKIALSGRDDPHMFVNWNCDNNSVEDLPAPAYFVRHFAVCLIPLHDWNDHTMSLLQKFEHATYWELPCPHPVSGPCEGVSWSADKIRSIDGMKRLGHTTYDNEAISEQFYQPLRAAWDAYDTVWWNGFDFATRLACMILPGDEPKRRLKHIIMTVCWSRVSHSKGALISWSASFLTGLATHVSFYVAAAVTVVGSVASTTPLAGLPVAAAAVAYWWRSVCIELGDMRAWKLRSKLLEDMFPPLVGLIDEPDE